MINPNGIQLANAHLLDDVMYDEYSNNDGEGKFPTKEALGAGAAVAAGLISTIASKPKDPYKAEMKAACGRKPFLASRRKKDAYQKCASSYLKNKNEAEARARAEQDAANYDNKPNYAPDKKFLGMPMGAGITVAVIVVAAIGFGVYKLIKR